MSDRIASVKEALTLLCLGACDSGNPLSALNSFQLHGIAEHLQDGPVQLDALNSTVTTPALSPSPLEDSQCFAAGVWRISTPSRDMDPRLHLFNCCSLFCERVPRTLFILFPAGNPLGCCLLGIVTETGDVFDNGLACKLVSTEGHREPLVVHAGSWSCKGVDDKGLDARGALHQIGAWSFFAREHLFVGNEHIFLFFDDNHNMSRCVLVLSVYSRVEDIVVLRGAEGLFVPLRECSMSRDSAFTEQFLGDIERYLHYSPKIWCNSAQIKEFLKLLMTIAKGSVESSAVLRLLREFLLDVSSSSGAFPTRNDLFDACLLLENSDWDKDLFLSIVPVLFDLCEKHGGEPAIIVRLLATIVVLSQKKEDNIFSELLQLVHSLPNYVLRSVCVVSTTGDQELNESAQRFRTVLQHLCNCLFECADSQLRESASQILTKCIKLESAVSHVIVQCLSEYGGFDKMKPSPTSELILLCSRMLESFSLSQQEFDFFARRSNVSEICISYLTYLNECKAFADSHFHTHEALMKVLLRCVEDHLFADGKIPESLFIQIQQFFLNNSKKRGSNTIRVFCQLFCAIVGNTPETKLLLAPEMIESLQTSLRSSINNYDTSFALLDCLISVLDLPNALEQIGAYSEQLIENLMELSERYVKRPVIVGRIGDLLIKMIAVTKEKKDEELSTSITEFVQDALDNHPQSPLHTSCPQLISLLSPKH